MYKSLTNAAVLSLALLGSAQALEPPRSPLEVVQTFERRFNAFDAEGLLKLYGKDAVLVPAPGTSLREPARIRGALTQFMASKVPIKLAVRHIYQAGDTALIVLDWTIKGTDVDGKTVDMAGTGSDVVVRQADGSWAYAIDNPSGTAQPAK